MSEIACSILEFVLVNDALGSDWDPMDRESLSCDDASSESGGGDPRERVDNLDWLASPVGNDLLVTVVSGGVAFTVGTVFEVRPWTAIVVGLDSVSCACGARGSTCDDVRECSDLVRAWAVSAFTCVAWEV